MQYEVELFLQKKREKQTVEGGRRDSQSRRDRKLKSLQEAVDERGQMEVYCCSC
jgi:hypothetical protein